MISPISWMLIGASILTAVMGQLSLKYGLSKGGGLVSNEVWRLFLNPYVLAGLALYGGGALAWMGVLRRVDLSLAYPFLALNFVLVPVVAHFILNEAVPAGRWVGIAVIVGGILIVARSG
ncbi:MAG: multidrug resistance protein [Chloroflexi bacterium]|nr:multidrug resistance protein [Chloroflexota bacterium]